MQSLLRIVLLALIWAPAMASDTVILNHSPALDCYRAALDGGGAKDIEVCTTAIEHQTLAPLALAGTYSNRGILKARNGDLAAALKDHNRARRIAPEVASIHINRSNVLVGLKRYSGALRDLNRAIALADASLAVAHYNRALLFQTLGDRQAARGDAERAAQLAPESEAYQRFARNMAQ